ncbi:MAG: hypothetical protein HOV94_24645, partial [Saccharothrix sp.]|nr:hypothetical protein [Saccharothrix sp.]
MTHPQLQQAMDGCVRLAEAARTVGSPDPIQAIRQIDYDPQAVEDYGRQLGDAAKDLDKAIEEHEKAIAEHEAGGEGSASESAQAAMSEELAELRDERKRLQALIDQVDRIAKRMDELARSAGEQVLVIAGRADPAVAMVLDGSWLDDVTGEGAQAEETVHLAVAEIIKVCQATQDQVAVLRSELNAAMDTAEAGGVQGGEAQSGDPGAGAQGGGRDEGESQGGTGQGGSEGGTP